MNKEVEVEVEEPVLLFLFMAYHQHFNKNSTRGTAKFIPRISGVRVSLVFCVVVFLFVDHSLFFRFIYHSDYTCSFTFFLLLIFIIIVPYILLYLSVITIYTYFIGDAYQYYQIYFTFICVFVKRIIHKLVCHNNYILY